MSSSGNSPSQQQKPSFFARDATGLVRSMNWVDLMFLNVVSFGGAWSIIYALVYAPYYGGDPAVSLLLTAPGILCLLGVYYIYNTSMPRSGGDYVYISRSLHPAIGLAANFVGYTMFLWFWIGDAASVFTSNGLYQTLSVYGSLTKASWTSSLSSLFVSSTNNFIIGVIALVAFAALVIVSPKAYFRIQNVFMTIAVIALAIIAILLVTALFNPSGFQSNFNAYANSVGASPALSSNAYQNLTASGAANGTSPNPTNWTADFALIPLWFTVLFWVFVSNYLGGETKQVNSTAKKALFGSFAIIFIATLIILETAYYALGYNFLIGAANVYYAGTGVLGAPPNLTLFAGILAHNAALVLFLGIGIVAGFILVAPQSMILMSRILFSYSFDRVAPTWISDVNQRFSTPVKATLIALAGAIVMLAFLSGLVGGVGSSFQSTALALYTWAGLATIGLTFTFVSISAIVFPYRRRDLYGTAASVKRKVAGVPVITWLGIVALAYSLGTIIWYSYAQVFYLFACTPSNVTSCDYNYYLITIIVLFFVTIAYYFGVRSYRQSKGIPFNKVFAEIPPE
jgi:APA family basic amino acid/polyamine antiporter